MDARSPPAQPSHPDGSADALARRVEGLASQLDAQRLLADERHINQEMRPHEILKNAWTRRAKGSPHRAIALFALARLVVITVVIGGAAKSAGGCTFVSDAASASQAYQGEEIRG